VVGAGSGFAFEDEELIEDVLKVRAMSLLALYLILTNTSLALAI
jgi:hypothetical protein